MGDGAGIGPEVIVPAVLHPDTLAVCRPVVIGDARRLRQAAAIVGVEADVVPIAGPSVPSTMLNTPAGMPARSASTASAMAESGVSSAGLETTVQPTASAGATLRAIIAVGKFQGVIVPTTPTGCLMTIMRLSALAAGIVSPLMRFASSAYHST